MLNIKEGHSTTLCTSMALEVIKYYMENCSNVFALFLDAIKAFDNVVIVSYLRFYFKKEFPHYT